MISSWSSDGDEYGKNNNQQISRTDWKSSCIFQIMSKKNRNNFNRNMWKFSVMIYHLQWNLVIVTMSNVLIKSLSHHYHFIFMIKIVTHASCSPFSLYIYIYIRGLKWLFN